MPGTEFAEAAVKLAGFAGVLLGWRPGEFWAATPAELQAVVAAMIGDDGACLRGDELSALRERFPDE